jgi:hypothetical protein
MKYVIVIKMAASIYSITFKICKIHIWCFVSVVAGSKLESWTAISFNLGHRANAIAAEYHGVSRRIVQLCGWGCGKQQLKVGDDK